MNDYREKEIIAIFNDGVEHIPVNAKVRFLDDKKHLVLAINVENKFELAIDVKDIDNILKKV